MIDKKLGEKPIFFELSIGNAGNMIDGHNESSSQEDHDKSNALGKPIVAVSAPGYHSAAFRHFYRERRLGVVAKHHGGHQTDIQRQGVLLFAVARGQAVLARQIRVAGLQEADVQLEHH